MQSYRVIIPARYASTRLPGKPLLDLVGKTMIQRVYERALASNADEVIIATDDARIKQAVDEFGGNVVITAPDHESGTDRLQEVVSALGLRDEDIVVNVQGDEPLIPPELIEQVAANLANSDAGIATLSEPVKEFSSLFDPNIVKVVSDKNGFALYFSRAAIPFCRDQFGSDSGSYKDLVGGVELSPYLPSRHIGIYAYRVKLLHDFVKWGPCTLEQTERLEQLRAMWYGVKIHVATAVTAPPIGIDTPSDLDRVRALIEKQERE